MMYFKLVRKIHTIQHASLDISLLLLFVFLKQIFNKESYKFIKNKDEFFWSTSFTSKYLKIFRI